MGLTQVSSKGIKDSTLLNEDVNASAAIAGSKLANNSINASDKLENSSITENKLGSGVVSSAKIADGTIINGDINASAAIAGSKINPNFGSQALTCGSVDSNGGIIGSSLQLDSSTVNYIYYTDSLQIAKSGHGTELTIDSSGNVGIGTASPDDTLHVAGNIINTTSVSGTGDSGFQIANNQRLGFDQSGTRSWSVKATGGVLKIDSGDGNSAPQVRGILFGSDTADANKLDDYEEGNWTPTQGNF